METVGEQLKCCMFTNAQHRKIEKVKIRMRRGIVPRKRLHVLRNPTKLAFKEWKVVPEPQTYSNGEECIEWCHIDKKFPPKRHRKN
jgi:hypothetical protein